MGNNSLRIYMAPLDGGITVCSGDLFPSTSTLVSPIWNPNSYNKATTSICGTLNPFPNNTF